MANKVAIVTGASGNLGNAVVKKFLMEGYMVVGTVGPNDPVEISNADGRFEAVPVNLMDEDSSSKFIDSTIQKHKRIDVAVLTVGGFAMGSIEATKTVEVLKQYKLNFETAYNVARPVFMHMLQQKLGRIFIIGSRPGLEARYSKGMIAYGLSKTLLFRLAELMNEEAKGSDVVTSVVVPSTIDTAQNRKAMPDADATKWVKPAAIADVIFYYSSDAASTLREPIIKVYNKA